MIDSKDLFSAQIPKTISDDDLIDELLLNETIRNFAVKYDLTHDEMVSGLIEFVNYRDDTITNKNGKKESKSVPGYVLELTYNEGKIGSVYKRIAPKQFETKIKLYKMPKELAQASFSDFQIISDDRRKAYNYARLFINKFKTEEQIKGLYLCGSFRSGKTYLASAIGNEIANKGYSVIEVFCPELSSALKESMFDSDNSFNELVDSLKTCDLLILDDFCGETVSPRIRDEAFLVVLNERMIKNKPVIFTSNIAMKQIPDIQVKDNSESEKFKAARLETRVEEISEQIIIREKFIDKSIF